MLSCGGDFELTAGTILLRERVDGPRRKESDDCGRLIGVEVYDAVSR